MARHMGPRACARGPLLRGACARGPRSIHLACVHACVHVCVWLVRWRRAAPPVRTCDHAYDVCVCMIAGREDVQGCCAESSVDATMSPPLIVQLGVAHVPRSRNRRPSLSGSASRRAVPPAASAQGLLTPAPSAAAGDDDAPSCSKRTVDAAATRKHSTCWLISVLLLLCEASLAGNSLAVGKSSRLFGQK